MSRVEHESKERLRSIVKCSYIRIKTKDENWEGGRVVMALRLGLFPKENP